MYNRFIFESFFRSDDGVTSETCNISPTHFMRHLISLSIIIIVIGTPSDYHSQPLCKELGIIKSKIIHIIRLKSENTASESYLFSWVHSGIFMIKQTMGEEVVNNLLFVAEFWIYSSVQRQQNKIFLNKIYPNTGFRKKVTWKFGELKYF